MLSPCRRLAWNALAGVHLFDGARCMGVLLSHVCLAHCLALSLAGRLDMFYHTALCSDYS